MNKPPRIDVLAGSAAICFSLIIDGTKFLLDLTGVGIVISFVVGIFGYLGNAAWFSLHNVSPTERGFAKLLVYVAFGALPASTTIGTAISIIASKYDDKRYNEKGSSPSL